MPSLDAHPSSHRPGTLKPPPVAVNHTPAPTATRTYKDGEPTRGSFARTQFASAAKKRAHLSLKVTCERCKVAQIECTADRRACERCAVENLKCAYAVRGTGRYDRGAGTTSLAGSTQSTAERMQPTNLKRRPESDDEDSDQPSSKKARVEDLKGLRVPLATLAGMTPRQLLALASKLEDGTKPKLPSSVSPQSQPCYTSQLSAVHTGLAMTGLRKAGFRRMFQVVRLPTMEDMISALTEDGRHISGLTSSPATSSSSLSSSQFQQSSPIVPSASKRILGWDESKPSQTGDDAQSGSKTGITVSSSSAPPTEGAAPYFVPPFAPSKRTSSNSSLDSTLDDLFDEPYVLRPVEARDWSVTSQDGSEVSLGPLKSM